METTLSSLDMPPVPPHFGNGSDSEDIDLNVAADLLAGMLEVELTEGDPSELRQPKPAKMPRTKTTKRKQRPVSPATLAERAKVKAVQFLKDSDKKLKMNCCVVLERVNVPPQDEENQEKEDSSKPSETKEPEAPSTKAVEAEAVEPEAVEGEAVEAVKANDSEETSKEKEKVIKQISLIQI